MKTGDKVKVNDPSWRDATGRVYDAGKYHGKKGVIAEVTEYRVGPETLYEVDLGNGLVCGFWTSELRGV